MQRGCSSCHLGHAAATAPDAPAICASCHETDRPAFAGKHMGYPTSKARCTGCHDPHGSNTPGMLWDHVHPPVAAGQCGACHEGPTSRTPLAVKQVGMALCGGCHAKMASATLARTRLHQPVAEGACLACHAPHGSRERGLLKAGMVATCGDCHEDTIDRQRSTPRKHPPVAEGRCTLCHEPHASDFPLLFTTPSQETTCRRCHSGEGHGHQLSARQHPRNPNLPMDCMSCHRAHGTRYDHLLPVAKRDQLCVRCHVTREN
jgi:predicted CXXCH cytochrome family protein